MADIWIYTYIYMDKVTLFLSFNHYQLWHHININQKCSKCGFETTKMVIWNHNQPISLWIWLERSLICQTWDISQSQMEFLGESGWINWTTDKASYDSLPVSIKKNMERKNNLPKISNIYHVCSQLMSVSINWSINLLMYQSLLLYYIYPKNSPIPAILLPQIGLSIRFQRLQRRFRRSFPRSVHGGQGQFHFSSIGVGHDAQLVLRCVKNGIILQSFWRDRNTSWKKN